MENIDMLLQSSSQGRTDQEGIVTPPLAVRVRSEERLAGYSDSDDSELGSVPASSTASEDGDNKNSDGGAEAAIGGKVGSTLNGDVGDSGEMEFSDKMEEIEEQLNGSTISAFHEHQHGFAYRRAVSDTFAMSDGVEGHVEQKQQQQSQEQQLYSDRLPTLRRFPCTETRNKNCWSQAPIEVFRVRGPGYLSSRKKKKIESQPFLLQARGCDLFQSSASQSLLAHLPLVLGGTLRRKPTLIINFRFPWGMLVHYYEIPEKFVPLLDHCDSSACHEAAEDSKKEFDVDKGKGQASNTDGNNDKISRTLQNFADTFHTPAELCFAKWLIGDDDYKNRRLKLIPHISEGPWVVKNTVTGKPALIGTKLPVTYHCELSSALSSRCSSTEDDNNVAKYLAPYLLCELDVGSSSNTAKRIVTVCRRYMTALTVDMGFVIQGNSEEEFPEQMLGCVRVHQIDAMRAPVLP